MKRLIVTDSLLTDKLKKMSPMAKRGMLPFLIKGVGLLMALKILFGSED